MFRFSSQVRSGQVMPLLRSRRKDNCVYVLKRRKKNDKDEKANEKEKKAESLEKRHGGELSKRRLNKKNPDGVACVRYMGC
jgi:hypothetical protein